MRDTDIEFIYNTYLKISRVKQNKPYKLRTDFSDFKNTEHYAPILKLKNFFDRNYTVNIEDFFVAPYEVYEEEGYYDLSFYNSLAAIKVYNLFCNKITQLEPDSDLQVKNIIRGLKFIEKFCSDNKVKLENYLNHKKENSVTNSFIIHLKEKNISIYNLFAFKNFERIYSGLDYEVLRFILKDIPLRISILRAKYYASKIGKNLSIKGLKLIENKLKKIS
jgi:hypothetical protein